MFAGGDIGGGFDIRLATAFGARRCAIVNPKATLGAFDFVKVGGHHGVPWCNRSNQAITDYAMLMPMA